MKNIIRAKVIFSSMVFLSNLGFSAIVGSAKLEGIIVQYNKTTVVLSQKGKKIRVPRTSIPKFFKIQTGQHVYALVKGASITKQLKKKKPL